ncbi:MAG: hypothetical protein ACI9G1_002570 [Pirellulaceae bacterium]|jgi:hypothetical protein
MLRRLTYCFCPTIGKTRGDLWYTVGRFTRTVKLDKNGIFLLNDTRGQVTRVKQARVGILANEVEWPVQATSRCRQTCDGVRQCTSLCSWARALAGYASASKVTGRVA